MFGACICFCNDLIVNCSKRELEKKCQAEKLYSGSSTAGKISVV